MALVCHFSSLVFINIQRDKIVDKTILFDLDGTLIDSTPAILFGFHNSFLIHNDTPPSDDAIKAQIGHTLEDIMSALGVQNYKIKSYVDAYKDSYKSVYLKQTTLLNSAFEALQLATNISDVGIVTTKTTRYSIDILENLGVMRFIKTVVGRDDVKLPKPNSEPINLALSRLSKDNKNAFMIGDTKLDLLAANNANVIGLGLLCGYGDEKSLRQHTNFIFKNALEAVKFIQER